MHTKLFSLALAALLWSATSCIGAEVEADATEPTGPASHAARGAVSVDLFHDALSPYGAWIDSHSRIRPIQVAPPRPGVVMQVRVEGDRARSIPVEPRAGRRAAPVARPPIQARPRPAARQRPRAEMFGPSVLGPVAAPPFARDFEAPRRRR